MSLVLSELGSFEKEAILDYLASSNVNFESLTVSRHVLGASSAETKEEETSRKSKRKDKDAASGRVTKVSNETATVAVDVDFPEDFFDVLAEMADEASIMNPSGSGIAEGGGFDDDDDADNSDSFQHDRSDAKNGIRGRSLQWLKSNINKFYDYRWTQFHLEFTNPSHHVSASRRGHERESGELGDVATHLFFYLGNTMGVGDIVRRYSIEILESIRLYRSEDLDVQLFGILLHSRSFDVTDVKALLSWSYALVPYEIVLRTQGGMQQSYVRLKDVPFLARLCLKPSRGPMLEAKGSVGSSLIPPQRSRGAWERCRGAFCTWCDSRGRVPAIVADPKFYSPPFPESHPYVGRRPGSAVDEGRFAAFGSQTLIPTAQLLVLMLLNFKEERSAPL